ncbi:hypothetical protein ILYODFUR_019663 [Ilyodon furcidens]|uniref:Uncharacterized protein n=1 Tax=Ilyodon furcidens TaxID=33524 RepID=A0ABV0T1L3_9TELE
MDKRDHRIVTIIVGDGEAGGHLQQSTGRRCSTARTGHLTNPSQGNTQTTMHTFIHTPKGNLERAINLTSMSLDCGRKPEYLVGTHACMGRTYKLHAERPPARSRTQDLLAARQQCN